jgi:hypothetical protein
MNGREVDWIATDADVCRILVNTDVIDLRVRIKSQLWGQVTGRGRKEEKAHIHVNRPEIFQPSVVDSSEG